MTTSLQESGTVPRVTAEDLDLFIRLLLSRRPAEWRMSRRTYYRWREGDVSEALEILFANPELAQAFAAASLAAHVGRLRQIGEYDPEE